LTSCERDLSATRTASSVSTINEIAHAQRRDHAMLGANVAAARLREVHVAAHDVSCLHPDLRPPKAAVHEPTSLQPISAWTIALAEVRSITA